MQGEKGVLALGLGGMCRYMDMLFCFVFVGLIWSNWYLSLALLL